MRNTLSACVCACVCVCVYACVCVHACIGVCVCRKNNIDNFIPDRQPDFPDEKFSKVKGDSFFVDENQLVRPPPPIGSERSCDTYPDTY